MYRILGLLLLISPLIGSEKYVEYFLYWAPEIQPQDSLMLSQIQEGLLQKGIGMRNWNSDSYFPWLIRRKQIHNWQEFKWWLDWDLPRKQPLSEDTAFCIFWNFGARLKKCDFRHFPKEKMILVQWEPPVVEPEAFAPEMVSQFGTIFTWNDDLIDGKKYFKIYYPEFRPRIESVPSFEEKKFCTMIATHLTSKHPKSLYFEREKTIRFFEDKPGEFDLYGGNWERRKYINSRGRIPNKIDVLKNYKFCICYENTKDVNGYITEKIFDCFAAGVVPVYWGASNITDYIPKEAFIDRRNFQNEEELYKFLKSITKEEYENYLKAFDAFSKTAEAQLFTYEHFTKAFLSVLDSFIEIGIYQNNLKNRFLPTSDSHRF